MIVIYLLYFSFLLLPAVAVAAYHIFLMTARFAGAHALAEASKTPTYRFAIVVPAHNEEDSLAGVIRSCAELDYPSDKYQVFVVADNCSDRTAQIAISHGVHCLVRQDVERAGKGYALEWAFGQIVPMDFDAVVVLDADCLIERHALRVFDNCLEQGSRVLQANHSPSNPDVSPISYLAMVGNLLEYDYFYAPKSSLGLAVMLVGTGMVLHRDILQSYPWAVHSAVEDAEYTLLLAQNNVHVRFISNASVVMAAAERTQQLTIQRKRWAGGTLRLGRRHAATLMYKGLFTRRLHLADTGLTLLIVSRPVVLLHAIAAFVVAIIFQSINPSTFERALLVTAASVLAIYIVYFAIGIALVGLNRRRARFLLFTPVVLFRLMRISVMAGLSEDTPWMRTPR